MAIDNMKADQAREAEPNSSLSKKVTKSSKTRFWRISNEYKIFSFLLLFRLFNAWSVRTFFQPDEYYQALEPAWYMVFGSKGQAWMTWEWREHLRSSLHPVIFAISYNYASQFADLVYLSDAARAEILLLAPKIMQSCCAALGDFYTWRLSGEIYGRKSRAAQVVLALTVLSPWQWFCSTRTFSNCLEMTLTTVALYHWPFSLQNRVASQGAEEELQYHIYGERNDLIPSQKHYYLFVAATSSLMNRLLGTKLSIAIALCIGAHGYWTRQPDERPPAETSGIFTIRDQKFRTVARALFPAVLATVLRPTNVIIWACLVFHLFFQSEVNTPLTHPTETLKGPTPPSSRSTIRDILRFLKDVLSITALVLIFAGMADFGFYSELTFPPLNFFFFNVVMSLAVFYGNNDWHYYVSQGYPLLLTTALPFTLLGMRHIFANTKSFQGQPVFAKTALRALAYVCVVLPAALSVLSHKEVRFIYPILPALHIFAAEPITKYFGPVLGWEATSPGSSSKLPKQILLGVLLFLNITIAFYTTRVHNSGILPLTTYLRHEFEKHYASNEIPTMNIMASASEPPVFARSMTVGFFMPCHSVPWRSHLQYPATNGKYGIEAWALTCEPPLHVVDPEIRRSYRDEADLFYDDPSSWIRHNMARSIPDRGIDKRDTRMNRTPGLYADITGRNKKLWGKLPPLSSIADTEETWDITKLLPYLITKPLDSKTLPNNGLPTGKKPAQARKYPFDIKAKFLTYSSDPKNLSSSPSSAPFVKRPWPHYIAFFQHLEPMMQVMLRGSGYRECWRHFNSHWHDDSRRTGDVIVWCLRPREEGGGYEDTDKEENDDNDAKPVYTGRRPRGAIEDRESSGQRMLKQLYENRDENRIL